MPVALPGCALLDVAEDLLLATIERMLVDAARQVVNTAVGGVVELINEQASTQTGRLVLELLEESDAIVDAAFGEFELPARTVTTLGWSGLASDLPGRHRARSQSALNSALSEIFDIFS